MRVRLLVASGALIAFGASLGSGFHFDDYAIFADPALTSPPGWSQLWSPLVTRPLAMLTFWLNYQIGGQTAAGYHAVNLALHIGAALLLYSALRIARFGVPVAWAAAGFFAIHPIQTGAVDYVWARPILLATVFCLLSLYAWLEDRPWLAALWFVPALLAKEECAAWPLALLAISHGRPGGKRWRAIAVMVALALAAGARVIWATSVVPGAPAGVQAGISPARYALAQGTVVLRYLRLLVVPWGFTVDPEIHVPPVWIGVLAWAAVVAIAGLFWWRLPEAGPWICAGLLLLLPSSSIFPAADLAADRRMYLPMVGFAAAFWILAERLRRPAAVFLLLAGLTAVSFARTEVWRSDRALWTEAVRCAPGKVRPKLQLARAVDPQEALPLLAQAKALAPDDPEVASETGRVLLELHRPSEALAEFGRALALAPGDARNYNNRGVALQFLGQSAAAREDFERALAMDPCLADARQNLKNLGVDTTAPESCNTTSAAR